MRGLLLAGGSGLRLYPLTLTGSKQLLPVYDKPMICYPLSTLMLAGIREILVISTPEDRGRFEALLGTGAQWGLRFSYSVQARPEGIAQAFVIGAEFIRAEPCALVLGDNIFHGFELSKRLQEAARHRDGAMVFAYPVQDPERYDVVTFDKGGRVVAIHEKPTSRPSRYAVTGLYFYDPHVVEAARSLHPSARGELEITDINTWYLERQSLHVVKLGRGMAWLDTGTHDALLAAALFIETIEKRQGLKIAYPEEIAYCMGYITAAELTRLASPLKKNGYGQYLLRMLEEEG